MVEGRQYLVLERRAIRSQCKINRAINQSSADVVALAEFPHNVDQGIPCAAIRELVTLSNLQHRNVARFMNLEVNWADRSISLAFELISTNVEDYIVSYGRFEGLKLKRGAHQCVQAMVYLHSNRISHGYLKAPNVLINPASQRIVFSDFSRSSNRTQWIQTEPEDRYRGQPIEVALGANTPCRFSGDIWSLGCLIAEMGTAAQLFAYNECHFARLVAIFKVLGTPTETTWPGVSKLPYFSSKLPRLTGKGLQSVLQKCNCQLDFHGIELLNSALCCDPSGRQSATELLRHNFFYDIKFETEVLSVIDQFTQKDSPCSLVDAHILYAHGSPKCFANKFVADIRAYLGLVGNSEIDVSGHDCVNSSKDDIDFRRLKAVHRLSQKHMPASQSIQKTKWCKSNCRDGWCIWMMKVCTKMAYADAVLFDFILMVDRYINEHGEHDATAREFMLAAILVSLKLNYTTSTLPESTFAAHIAHLSHNEIRFADVNLVELTLVGKLRGVIGTPTTLDSLQAIGECTGIGMSGALGKFAKSILRWSLLDVQLQYGFPHLNLAAAALLMAMSTFHAPMEVGTRVVQKVAAIYGSMSKACWDMYRCCYACYESNIFRFEHVNSVKSCSSTDVDFGRKNLQGWPDLHKYLYRLFAAEHVHVTLQYAL